MPQQSIAEMLDAQAAEEESRAESDVEASETEEITEEVETDEADEEVDEEEGSEEEVAESDEEEADPEGEEGEATAEFESLAEIAEALEMESESDFLNKYKVTVKVDGEEREVTLQEAADGFRFNAHNTQTAQKLADDRREFDEERKTKLEEADKNFSLSGLYLESLKKQFLGGYTPEYLEKVRTERPED